MDITSPAALEAYVNESSALSLMSLNDDCILHILQYLPLKDIILMKRVNKRMNALCHTTCSDAKSLHVVNEFPGTPIKKLRNILHNILEQCGPKITNLNLSGCIYDPIPSVLPEVGHFFPNLRVLNLSKCKIVSEDIIPLGKTLEQLTSLSFNGALIHTDVIKLVIQFGGNLETLELDEITGMMATQILINLQSATTLHNLKTLFMKEISIEYKTIINVFPNLNHLKCKDVTHNSRQCLPESKITKLEIFGCSTESHGFLRALDKMPFLSNLKVRMISMANFLTRVEVMQRIFSAYSLKHVEFYHLKGWNENFLGDFPELPFQLESFSCHGTKTISSRSILQILQANLQSIKSLDISCCTQLEDETFIKEINDLVSLNSKVRKAPLHVIVHQATMANFTPEIYPNIKLINFKFSCTDCFISKLNSGLFNTNMPTYNSQ